MVNLLIAVFITSVANAYAVEFLKLLTFDFWGSNFGVKFFTLPLSVVGLYLFGFWDRQTFVAVPAATLMAVVLLKWVNKPVAVPVRARRLPQVPNLP